MPRTADGVFGYAPAPAPGRKPKVAAKWAEVAAPRRGSRASSERIHLGPRRADVGGFVLSQRLRRGLALFGNAVRDVLERDLHAPEVRVAMARNRASVGARDPACRRTAPRRSSGNARLFDVSVEGVTPVDGGGSSAEPMMTNEEGNYEVLLELCAAFNAHDLDRIMTHFAEDASLDMPKGSNPWGTRFVGKESVRMGLAMRFEATPDVHYGDARHWAFGSMGVSEWLLIGTTRDGRKIAVRGCDHYEFRGGKVVRKDSYWKIVE